MYEELHKLDELSRRKFLQYSAKALLGVGLCSVGQKPAWASEVNPHASTKNVIYVFLQGGMSQIDTFDLKPDWAQQGPVLRRMSAEQIWDSIATLLIPDVDALYTDVYTTKFFNSRYTSDQPPAVVRLAEAYSKNKLVDHLQQFAATFGPYNNIQARLQAAKSKRLNDPQTYAQLERQFEELSAEYHRLIDPIELVSEQSRINAQPDSADSMMGSNADSTNRALRNIRRASELASPVKSGHLLQTFGQSDRQLIENSSRESNLLQALFMMNSHETNVLMAESSMPVLEADLALSAEEKLATIFIGFLSRRPTAEEQDLLIDDFRIDPINARKRIIWSMLNSQQFVFLQ